VVPTTPSKIPVVVGISAEDGDPKYEGPADVHTTLIGPQGAHDEFSFRVDLQKGNPGAMKLRGRTGGRTTFIVSPQ
jgi:hypothetical protein